MDLGLKGLRALVTGGTRGIGLAIARALLREGARVSVCARDGERLAKAVAELGPGAHGTVADVTDPGRLTAAVEAAAAEFGGLDLVVANAGGSVGGDLAESTAAEWTETFALNAGHAAQAVRAALPHLEASPAASVLVVASISGWKPGSRTSYSIAKAAEIQLARSLAEELAPRGIRVNALSPGSVEFEGGRWGRLREEQPAAYAEFARFQLPSGRLVELDEVADAACFVLSPRGSGFNGANICVDGGQDRPTDRRFYP
ncbi:3-oxoacyl-[acyl-carrier protein] reductase [Actinocorallia herbida]|uniref:3-oxoacyl-[acyl-carrier protein] reductase n=1 Tax=Actinocorallia herbida TaxID=58109 RepID=A0A3N1CN34_9ACTN|nr:SDR family oxidoreductase [Actinocorallia herbida]ROO82729.1 3-oxoacyl-[acyl-carrier protein] reductase [Actinocorallia herbida]